MDARAQQDPFGVRSQPMRSEHQDWRTKGMITHKFKQGICVSKLNISTLIIHTAGDTWRP